MKVLIVWCFDGSHFYFKTNADNENDALVEFEGAMMDAGIEPCMNVESLELREED